jgi:hypothetical protein
MAGGLVLSDPVYTADPLNLLTLDQALMRDGWWSFNSPDGVVADPYTGASIVGGVPHSGLWPLVVSDAPRTYSIYGPPPAWEYRIPRIFPPGTAPSLDEQYWTSQPTFNRLMPYNPVAWNPPHPNGADYPAYMALDRSTTYSFGVSFLGGSGSVALDVRLYDATTGAAVGGSYSASRSAAGRVSVTFTSPSSDVLVSIQILVESGFGWVTIADPTLQVGAYDRARPPTRTPEARPTTSPIQAFPPPEVTEWTFYVADVTTGSIRGDLPLVDFSGTVSLTGGAMSATVMVGALSDSDIRRSLEWTTPGRYSITAVRNGVVMGEWIIWQRTRKNVVGSFTIAGTEFVSFLNRRVMPAAGSFPDSDPVQVAAALLRLGFAGSTTLGGAVAVSVAATEASGASIAGRTYKLGDGTIGAKLTELANAETGGFEFLITPTLRQSTSGAAYVDRVARVFYPLAGLVQDAHVFEAAGPGQPAGNVLSAGTDEDGTQLASKVWEIGTGTTTGHYESDVLINAGYPYMDYAESITLDPQSTGILDDYAESVWQKHQPRLVPENITVLAGRRPQLGDYGVGDTVTLYIEPSPCWPDGLVGSDGTPGVPVRITEIGMKPASSGPETVALTIVPAAMRVALRRTVSGDSKSLSARVRALELLA